jgi:hypothetical protein
VLWVEKHGPTLPLNPEVWCAWFERLTKVETKGITLLRSFLPGYTSAPVKAQRGVSTVLRLHHFETHSGLPLNIPARGHESVVLEPGAHLGSRVTVA